MVTGGFHGWFSVPLGVHQEVGLLGHRNSVLSEKPADSTVAAPIYTPTTSAQGFQFCHILTGDLHCVFFVIAILVGGNWYLITV